MTHTAMPVSARSDDPTYALGRSEDEYQRLMHQADVISPVSRRILATGLRPGMRVLDVGCGVGDLSLLAAELVGPGGSVLGVDIDPNALTLARSRVAEAELDNVEFVHGDFRHLAADIQVDAVIGRFVLMYCGDPVDAVRAVASHLNAGGLVIFHELDMLSRAVSDPPMKRWDWLLEKIAGTLQVAGCEIGMARKLPRVLEQAGLRPLDATGEFLVGRADDAAMISWAVQTYRSLLPVALSHGLVTDDECDADRLRAEIAAELDETGGTVWAPWFVGASATLSE